MRESSALLRARARICRPWSIRVLLLAISGIAAAPQAQGQPPFTDIWIEPNGNVALLTDYGEKDFYVGALKGAILAACSIARIVDLTHEVPPYDVRLAAWELWDAAREFPPGTVFVAIVDPGVGTDRRPVVLQTAKGSWFVGPDNGLFTIVERELGPSVFRRITNKDWMRPGPISTSFHGRDIFGPAAGNLACGEAFTEAGPVVGDPVRLVFAPAVREGDHLVGEVLFADQYGNLQTNIPGPMLDSLGINRGMQVRIEIGGKTESAPLVLAYGDVPEGSLLVLVASTNRIEIAANQKSAAAHFGAERGAAVRLRRAP